jgi:glutathione S-transferase
LIGDAPASVVEAAWSPAVPSSITATLFAVPASHPSLAVELMLRHKRIGYRRIDLVTALHRPLLRALGFRGVTAPALRVAGARVQGSRDAALVLEALRPDPPLFPRNRNLRPAVERAEAWGEATYQPVPRRLVWAALKRDRSTIASYLAGARLGVPTPLAARTALPIIWASVRFNRASDENIQRDLAALPELIERVDALLAEGTIGGPELNAADFQIGTSTALLATLEDVRPLLEGRPALEHSLRVAPDYPGRMPKVFPSAWLAAPLGR